MVRLVDDYQIEEVLGKLVQPFVGIGGELVNVRQHDVRLFADADVPGFQGAYVRARDHIGVRQNLHPAPETFLPVRDIESFLEFVLYGKVRGDDEDAPPGDAKGQYRGETRLAAAHWQLDNGFRASRAEEIVSAQIRLALRISQVHIAFNVRGGVHEVRFEALIRPQPFIQQLLLIEPLLADLADGDLAVLRQQVKLGFPHPQVFRRLSRRKPF